MSLDTINSVTSEIELVDLSVVIPAYNELMRLPPTLDRVLEYLKERGGTWEIVVSDDGSRDGSIDQFEPRYPEVRFIRAPRNMGKGAAVRRGMMAARGRLLLFSDADLSTPIEELENLYQAMTRGDAQGAIASRGLPESKLEIRQPLHREMAGRLFNSVVRLFSGLPFHDTQCGFKLFTRDAGRAIFGRALDNGFAFDVEILMIAQGFGFKVVETPVRWINAEGSKVEFLRDGPKMVRDILRFRWQSIRGLYRAPAPALEKNESGVS